MPAPSSRSKRAWVGALLGLALGSAQAFSFSLPSLDGRQFVRSTELRGPMLLNFWSKDCPPCVAELPRLAEFARANPQWTVLLVTMDAPSEAQDFVLAHGVSLPVLRVGPNPTALLRSAGNRAGVLPYSLALRTGQICARQAGELSLDRLAQWQALCA